MDRRLFRFRGHLGGERGPGHQIDCGNIQCRDLGGR